MFTGVFSLVSTSLMSGVLSEPGTSQGTLTMCQCISVDSCSLVKWIIAKFGES